MTDEFGGHGEVGVGAAREPPLRWFWIERCGLAAGAGAEGFRLEGGVAGFDVAAEAALLVGIVEVSLEVLALGCVGVGGEFRVQAPCLVEAHHLQAHRGDVRG